MISPDLLAEVLIAELRADSNLIALLPEGANGVREAAWKGTAFRYPNVRVQRPTLKPWGNGNCTPHQSNVRLVISAFSKKDSSITVQTLQGFIAAALEGVRFDTPDLRTLPLRSDRRGPANPDTAFDLGDHWRGEVRFRTVVFEL